MLDLINRHVAKIALVLWNGEEESILSISRKIGSSYGWAYKWVKKLEEIGVLERRKGKGIVVKDRKMIQDFKNLARSVLKRKMELKDAYMLPNFSSMNYAFTKTDAVYIWTKGGYQIGRSKEDYPIFINVLERDLKSWKDMLKDFSVKFGVRERREEGIYFVLFPKKDFESEWVDNVSVVPLKETVRWAKEHELSFQPALEMLNKMYDLDLEVSYS